MLQTADIVLGSSIDAHVPVVTLSEMVFVVRTIWAMQANVWPAAMLEVLLWQQGYCVPITMLLHEHVHVGLLSTS